MYKRQASAITCVPVLLQSDSHVKVVLRNVMGETIEELHSGELHQGESKLFFNAETLASGAYVITLEIEGGHTYSQRVMVQ